MTTTSDILGRECLNYERLVLDNCRKCYGRNYRCPDYLARNITPVQVAKPNTQANVCNEMNYSQQIYVVGKPMTPSAQKTSGNVTSVTADTNFYLHHQSIREYVKPASLNRIRKASDGGVV